MGSGPGTAGVGAGVVITKLVKEEIFPAETLRVPVKVVLKMFGSKSATAFVWLEKATVPEATLACALFSEITQVELAPGKLVEPPVV
jgi:hypothetical protein